MPIISALRRAGSNSPPRPRAGGEGPPPPASGLLKPFQDDGGVETAGIGEHDLADAAAFRHCHFSPCHRGASLVGAPAASKSLDPLSKVADDFLALPLAI